MKHTISRREFLKTSTCAFAGLTIIPGHVVSGMGHTVPSDKLNIVGVGVGGRGRKDLNFMQSENIIGLCDVDLAYAKEMIQTYPKAWVFTDYRKMFDTMHKDIDAVVVATPDHTHAIVAAGAMHLGKHVYCEKPLTHSVYESRYLTELARKKKVATQMGNQGNSGEGVRLICEWIRNGEIEEVKEVHAWTNHPIWSQGLQRPAVGMSLPDTLSWDLFLGPAPYRPYHEIYTPWNWRGWWDFGTGALGDMACHILDPVFQALHLKYPEKVFATSTQITMDCAPHAEKVKFTFPARPDLPKVKMPEVVLHWYDGGFVPDALYELPAGVMDGKEWINGVIFKGSKDMLICGCYGAKPFLVSGRVPDVPKTLRRVETQPEGWRNGDHHMDWVRACKESPENRIPGSADFEYAGPLNETVVMGVLAVRLQGLHKELLWNGEQMKFTNISDQENIRVVKTDLFTVQDGHPTFNTEYVTLPAKETAEEFIKHNYREGWKLS